MNKEQIAHLLNVNKAFHPYWKVCADRLVEVINGTLNDLWINTAAKLPPLEEEILFQTAGGTTCFGKRISKFGKMGPVFLDYRKNRERGNVIRWRYP